MITFGLTGGIGMGKSAAGEILQRHGLAVIDTDEIARQVVTAGGLGLQEIVAEFGSRMLLPDGSLDRAALARQVFEDEGQRRKLEAILHPRIREAWQGELGRLRAAGQGKAVVVIPLLFETGAERLLDKTICVACSKRMQAIRLRQRGWSDREIAGRERAQWAVALKMDRSDYVIWNESSLGVCEEQLLRVV